MLNANTFHHGIHPPEQKLTAADPIRRLGFAPTLVIPLAQHIGAPARPIVREGEEVIRGQVIAEPGGFVSVPYHAPVSGFIKRIGPTPSSSGMMTQGIYLEAHPSSGQTHKAHKGLSVDSATPEQIADAVLECGMTGLGGAGFPTHVKYRLPKGKTADTFIVNGAECEPYLTADHRILLEKGDCIVEGIRFALKATGAQRAIIGIEANKMDAVHALNQLIPAHLPISVQAVKVKYPQGAEKMLIQALTGRKVPPGKLPIDIGVVVSNAATVSELGYLLPRGLGLIERVITVSGPGVKKKGNYLIPIGTPLRYVLEQAGLTDDAGAVLLGGPMMGQTAAHMDLPVTKGTSGIVVLGSTQPAPQIMPCIRCGYCVEACPMFLNPSKLGRLAVKRQYEPMADDFHLMDCFECGSCSFVCPSHIPLVQHFRVAKNILREKKARP